MWLAWVWDRLRSSLWLIPSLLMTGAVALAFGTLWIDHHYVEDDPSQPIAWLFGGGADGAREVLSTVASATVTIAGVVFSITVVALTLASEQFGPRVLRNFMRDVGTQVVLGTFISVHLFCLIVLRSVRAQDAGAFVPHASVGVAVLMAVAAVVVLVYFFHHMTASLRASNVIAHIAGDLESAIAHLFPEKVKQPGPAPAEAPVPTPVDPDTGACICSTRSGYLQTVEADQLVDLAEQQDITIALACRPGDFVMCDRPIAYAVPRERISDEVKQAINETCVLGDERTTVQDVGFPAHQLTEIAVRALSPGTNDPSTALACIDRLCAAFVQLAGRRTPSPYRYDDQGRLRLIAHPVEFCELVDESFGQIRQYGRTSSAVTMRLLDSIRAIAPHLSAADQYRALDRQAALIYEGTRDTIPLAQDRADIRERYLAARASLRRSASVQDGDPFFGDQAVS